MENKDKLKEMLTTSLAITLVLGFFVLLYILVFVEVSQQNKEILNLVVGALIGTFTQVINYYFGSSVGSKEKTKMLSKP